MLPNFPFSDLHDWYITHGRKSLPWRDYDFDNKTLGYRIWLAETMLQQTQVERVKDYFHTILEAFPTIEDLAKTSYEEFFSYYKGLGYYSRARNMLKAAKTVVDDFDGIFPENANDLRTLAGVGPYTAEAIRAFAYDIPTLSFDTNLEKIFSRYYFGNKFQKLSKQEKNKILESFQRTGISSQDINNALMDYGATISLNNISGIDWDNYPLPSSKFYQTRGSLEPIPEKKKSTFPNKQAYVIAVLHENHKIYFSNPTQDTNSLLNPHSFQEQGATTFTPFFIGKNTGNPRSTIQQYFLTHHGLDVSVRPPEIKSYNKEEIPYLVCYCQIQSGTHSFERFEGLKVRGFEEGYVEEINFGE